MFKHPDSTASIDEILADASPFAKTLDCFDANGRLPQLYGKHGFRPVARIAFDSELATPGMSLGEFPDVVLMIRDVDGISGAPEVPNAEAGGYAGLKSQVPLFEDWEAAADHREHVLRRMERVPS